MKRSLHEVADEQEPRLARDFETSVKELRRAVNVDRLVDALSRKNADEALRAVGAVDLTSPGRRIVKNVLKGRRR